MTQLENEIRSCIAQNNAQRLNIILRGIYKHSQRTRNENSAKFSLETIKKLIIYLNNQKSYSMPTVITIYNTFRCISEIYGDKDNLNSLQLINYSDVDMYLDDENSNLSHDTNEIGNELGCNFPQTSYIINGINDKATCDTLANINENQIEGVNKTAIYENVADFRFKNLEYMIAQEILIEGEYKIKSEKESLIIMLKDLFKSQNSDISGVCVTLCDIFLQKDLNLSIHGRINECFLLSEAIYSLAVFDDIVPQIFDIFFVSANYRYLFKLSQNFNIWLTLDILKDALNQTSIDNLETYWWTNCLVEELSANLVLKISGGFVFNSCFRKQKTKKTSKIDNFSGCTDLSIRKGYDTCVQNRNNIAHLHLVDHSKVLPQNCSEILANSTNKRGNSTNIQKPSQIKDRSHLDKSDKKLSFCLSCYERNFLLHKFIRANLEMFKRWVIQSDITVKRKILSFIKKSLRFQTFDHFARFEDYSAHLLMKLCNMNIFCAHHRKNISTLFTDSFSVQSNADQIPLGICGLCDFLSQKIEKVSVVAIFLSKLRKSLLKDTNKISKCFDSSKLCYLSDAFFIYNDASVSALAKQDDIYTNPEQTAAITDLRGPSSETLAYNTSEGSKKTAGVLDFFYFLALISKFAEMNNPSYSKGVQSIFNDIISGIAPDIPMYSYISTQIVPFLNDFLHSLYYKNYSFIVNKPYPGLCKMLIFKISIIRHSKTSEFQSKNQPNKHPHCRTGSFSANTFPFALRKYEPTLFIKIVNEKYPVSSDSLTIRTNFIKRRVKIKLVAETARKQEIIIMEKNIRIEL